MRQHPPRRDDRRVLLRVQARTLGLLALALVVGSWQGRPLRCWGRCGRPGCKGLPFIRSCPALAGRHRCRDWVIATISCRRCFAPNRCVFSPCSWCVQTSRLHSGGRYRIITVLLLSLIPRVTLRGVFSSGLLRRRCIWLRRCCRARRNRRLIRLSRHCCRPPGRVSGLREVQVLRGAAADLCN